MFTVRRYSASGFYSGEPVESFDELVAKIESDIETVLPLIKGA